MTKTRPYHYFLTGQQDARNVGMDTDELESLMGESPHLTRDAVLAAYINKYEATWKEAYAEANDFDVPVDVAWANWRQGWLSVEQGRSAASGRRHNPATAPAAALRMYETFHARDPKDIGAFPSSFQIPHSIPVSGDAIHVCYRSDKRDPATGAVPKRPVDYIHEHDPGVGVYCVDGDGPMRNVPTSIRSVKGLVLLGDCLEFMYRDHAGDLIEVKGRRPLPLLYATPSGQALLVVSRDKKDLLAIMWGGSLRVEARGIVG